MTDPAEPGDPHIQTGGGDFVARDKIVNTIQTYYQRSLTQAQEARLERDLERQALAEGSMALARSLQSIIQPDPIHTHSPYKGLLPFTIGESEIFYGRQPAIERLLQAVERGALTVLHSESGAGKTSLLQAGLAARLIAAGDLAIYLRPYNTDPAAVVRRQFLPEPSSALPELLHEFLAGVMPAPPALYLLSTSSKSHARKACPPSFRPPWLAA
jgi:hypothetical protein